MKTLTWEVFHIFKQNKGLAKFIHINNQEGTPYYINVEHIVCVYRHNIGQTLIRIQGGHEIITEVSMDEVINRIKK